jgi:hypothetical protein
MNSQAHERKFNDGPVQKPKLVEMGTQISGVFRSQVQKKCAPLTNVGPLSGFAPTVQRAALSGSLPKAPGSAGGYLP